MYQPRFSGKKCATQLLIRLFKPMLFGILLLSTKVFLTKNVTIKNHLLVLYETMH